MFLKWFLLCTISIMIRNVFIYNFNEILTGLFIIVE